MAAHRLTAAALAVPLATGLLIGFQATPAVAATGITSPSEGTVVSRQSVVAIKAKVDGLLEDGELLLQGPTDGRPVVVDRGTEDLTYSLKTWCPDYKGGCAGPAANGKYVARLDTGLLVLSTGQRQRTFHLKVPPVRPSDVTASPTGQRSASVRWSKGAEPDLVSYDVMTSTGAVLKRVGVDHACSGSSCRASVTLPKSNAGDQIGLAVRAHRATAPGSTSTVASPMSSPSTVDLPNPPKPNSDPDASTEPRGSSPAGGMTSAGRNAAADVTKGLARENTSARKRDDASGNAASRGGRGTSDKTIKLPDIARGTDGGDGGQPDSSYTPKLSKPGALQRGSDAAVSANPIAAIDVLRGWNLAALAALLALIVLPAARWIRRARSTGDGDASPGNGLASGSPDRTYHGRRRPHGNGEAPSETEWSASRSAGTREASEARARQNDEIRWL